MVELPVTGELTDFLDQEVEGFGALGLGGVVLGVFVAEVQIRQMEKVGHGGWQ